MVVADVKDAYLNCEQPKNVKVVLSADLAGRLGVAREWMLGKVLPGQREGAAVWFNTLKATLKDSGLLQCPEAPTVWTNASNTLTLMTHVDDMVMTGEDMELEKTESFLKQKFKLAVETGNQLSFLKRSIEIADGITKIRMNEKYIEGLVKRCHAQFDKPHRLHGRNKGHALGADWNKSFKELSTSCRRSHRCTTV